MWVIFTTYILPLMILLALCAVFGFALAYLGEKLKVERDPRIDEVLKLLAGGNCGACGYPGCEGFAKALVSGEAKLEDCAPTADEQRKSITEILKTE